VSEGAIADCTVDGAAQRIHAITPDEETKPTEETKPAAEAKPARRVKSKTARVRRSPSFMRRVDRFLNR
jgi:hypothetical protein